MIDTKEQLHQRLKDIKTQLRLSMNGAVSQSMREKGLVYKLNFGVELPRIKGIAAGYGASAVGRNPGAKGDVMSTMLLGQAVAETTGLYGLVVALILLFANPLYAKLH